MILFYFSRGCCPTDTFEGLKLLRKTDIFHLVLCKVRGNGGVGLVANSNQSGPCHLCSTDIQEDPRLQEYGETMDKLYFILAQQEWDFEDHPVKLTESNLPV